MPDPDEADALERALDETRAVIDHQIDLSENTEREIIRFIWLNVIILGASVRESVALLVAEHGIEGAEAELQRRFREGNRQQRALAGLAHLRREYDI